MTIGNSVSARLWKIIEVISEGKWPVWEDPSVLREKLQHAFKCCYSYLAIHRCTLEWLSLQRERERERDKKKLLF